MSNNQKILITRPEDKGKLLARELGEAGYKTLSAPMLVIKNIEFTLPDLNNVQGIIFTSAAALPPFIEQTQRKDIPIFTVGRSTAQRARKGEFKIIHSAHGAAKDLTRLIKRRGKGAQKHFLHIRGENVSLNISQKMSQEGIQIDEIIAYKAEKAQKLPKSTIDAIKNGEIEAVTFFSKRSAESFLYLARKYELFHALTSIKALSISTTVLKYALPEKWAETYSAKTPDHEGMKALIKEHCTRKKI